MVICGGIPRSFCDGTDFLNDLWLLDPDALAWKNLAGVVTGTSPSPRRYHEFMLGGDMIYVFGGYSNNGEMYRSTHLPNRLPLSRILMVKFRVFTCQVTVLLQRIYQIYFCFLCRSVCSHFAIKCSWTKSFDSP